MKTDKKYVLVDFYENEFGDVIVASDSMKEIEKSARQYRKDTDGECILFGAMRDSDSECGCVMFRV